MARCPAPASQNLDLGCTTELEKGQQQLHCPNFHGQNFQRWVELASVDRRQGERGTWLEISASGVSVSAWSLFMQGLNGCQSKDVLVDHAGSAKVWLSWVVQGVMSTSQPLCSESCNPDPLS